MRLATLLAVLLLPALARGACPEERGLPRLSNPELVFAADVVVLARPIDFREVDGRHRVTFRVEETLKGDAGGPYVVLPGLRAFQGRSRDADFSKVRPGARTGACVALDYREKYPYLLFLERRGSRFRLVPSQGARVNEEVDGADAPWPKAVRRYVELARLPAAAREAALEKLAAGPDAMLAADVGAHRLLPTGPKPYAALMALSKRPDFDRDAVLWAFAHGGHPEARPLVRRLLAEGEPGLDLEPIARWVEKTRDREAVPDLARAYLSGARRGERSTLLDALLAVASPDDAATLAELLRKGAPEHGPKVAAACERLGASARCLEALLARGGLDPSLRLARARLGDPAVREWALAAAGGDGADRPVAVAALVATPGEAADAAVAKLVAQGGALPLLVLRALAEPWAPRRVERLSLVAAGKREDPEERTLLRALLEDSDDPAAWRLLERWEGR